VLTVDGHAPGDMGAAQVWLLSINCSGATAEPWGEAPGQVLRNGNLIFSIDYYYVPVRFSDDLGALVVWLV